MADDFSHYLLPEDMIGRTVINIFQITNDSVADIYLTAVVG